MEYKLLFSDTIDIRIFIMMVVGADVHISPFPRYISVNGEAMWASPLTSLPELEIPKEFIIWGGGLLPLGKRSEGLRHKTFHRFAVPPSSELPSALRRTAYALFKMPSNNNPIS